MQIPHDCQNVNSGAVVQNIGAIQFHNNIKINGSNVRQHTKIINIIIQLFII